MTLVLVATSSTQGLNLELKEFVGNNESKNPGIRFCKSCFHLCSATEGQQFIDGCVKVIKAGSISAEQGRGGGGGGGCLHKARKEAATHICREDKASQAAWLYMKDMFSLRIQ